MTTDDILRMARKACGEDQDPFVSGWVTMDHNELARFAFLVAAAERERVARWMRERGYATGHGDTTEDLLGELRTQEREACIECIKPNATPMEAVAAIRARGNK